MKKFASIVLFCCSATLAAQVLYLYPTTAIAPRGSYQTVTAIITGVNNKKVTWSTSGGVLVGTNPCVVNEPCTIAVYDTSVETVTLTATSNANGSVVATSTLTFTASPTPVTTWPRFLFNSSNLAAMQAKAVSSDPMYENFLNSGIAAYNTDNAIWSWTCNGGTGQPSSSQQNNSREVDASTFSLLALLDPSDPTYNWKCYAHDVSLYVMADYAQNGFPGGQNGWSDNSDIWATLGDWLRGSGAVTTTGDLNALRTFYSFLAATVQNAGAASPYNSPAQFNSSPSSPADMSNMRTFTGNNYSMSRLLLLTAAGLTFNDNTTDAPNIPTGKYNTCGATRYQLCPDGTAGSLRAYWNYIDGSALYNYWAHIEDPNVSWQAYQAAYGNIPTQPMCEAYDLLMHPCFGDGRDGASSEGNYYEYSMYRMRWLFNMLHTAGMDDPLLYGPQMSASTSSWWDLKLVRDLEILTGPTNITWNPTLGINPSMPTYNPISMGDQNTYYWTVSNVATEAAMLSFDSFTGRTDRTNSLKWINFNLALGGPLGTAGGCNPEYNHCGWLDNVGNSYGSQTALDMFIALPAGNPLSTLPADPRPSLPTDFYDASFNQNGMVRTSWSNTNTLFTYWFNNSQIAHEYNYDGRFDVYSCLSGTCDYITKGRAIFNDYNWYMVSANLAQNELGIINSTGTGGPSYLWHEMYLNGGQFPQQGYDTFITSSHSELPTYAAVVGATTGAYNGTPTSPTFGTYNDVTAASRSIIYLRGSNQVVYYDRAAVGHSASTQSLQQIATGTPTISGNTASWPTQSTTQEAYFTSLLPSGGTLASTGLPCPSCVLEFQASDWEPQAVLQVTPPGRPTISQFLSVLQWGPSGLTPAAAALVQSTAGQNFDGSLIGSSLVMFMRSWPLAFTSVTYPASGATTHYISDLAPNTTYTISGDGAPASATTDTAGVLVFAAAGTGSITVGSGPSPSLQAIAVTPSVSSLQALAAQQYTAVCTYSDGSTTDCTSSVTWSSSAIGVVTINSSGVATGVAQGSATIIAASGGVQGQGSVTVTATVLQTIYVTPGTLAATVGSTQQFKATALFSDLSSADVTSQVSWFSSNPVVLATNSTGLVSMMVPGNAAVIAASGGVAGQAMVTVSLPAAPTFSPAGGTYSSAQTVTLTTATPSATIYYTTNRSNPTTSSTVYSGPITVSATETILAIAVANGGSTSQVNFANYTINSPPAAPTFSPAAGTYSAAQTVTMSSTSQSATIYYTSNGATPTTSSSVYSGPITVSATETLAAIAVANNGSASQVNFANYTISPPTALPTFNPAAGTYSSAQAVTITTVTPSATIYYTTNGATPTTSSSVYSGPIIVSATETLNAIAIATGASASAVNSATYTITLPAAAPAFSPAGGAYTSAQTVTISTTTPSATIYYTTNGATPTTSSPVYTGPIVVSATETLKATAVANGSSSSQVTSALYYISPQRRFN